MTDVHTHTVCFTCVGVGVCVCVHVRVRVCEADGWESLGSWITSQTQNTMS